MQNKYAGMSLPQAATETRLGIAKSLVCDSPPIQMLNQLVERFEQVNSRMAERIHMFSGMNDRLQGEQPSEANQKIDCGPGLIAQIEYQIRVYENLCSQMQSEIDRLSRL